MTVDTQFFHSKGPTPLEMLAKVGNAQLWHKEDGAFMVRGIATLDQAGKDDLSFLENRKYLESFKGTKAGACIVHPDMISRSDLPNGCRLILSDEPYYTYALIADCLFPNQSMGAENIHATAVIGTNVTLGKDCAIGAYAVIGNNVTISDGAIIGPHTWIGDGVFVGVRSVIESHVSISHAKVGERVYIHRGAQIGQAGFGFHIGAKGFTKVPQLGCVRIEDDVRVGANTTIDRGALQDTVIGRGTMIDNLVQIAHGVNIGKNNVIVAQAGIAGSTVTGSGAMFGGQAGIAGHLHIGNRVSVAGQSGVMRDIPDGKTVGGTPSVDIRDWHRLTALQARMLKTKSSKKGENNE